MAEMIDIVAQELNGLSFKALSTLAGGLVKANTVVVVTNWNGLSPNAVALSRNVPKAELEPEYSAVGGIRRYDVGLPAQRQKIKANQKQLLEQEKKIAEHLTKKGEYDKVKNTKGWEAQLKVLEEELARQKRQFADRQRVMSRMLVRQTMYNRFDKTISSWVEYYSKKFPPAKPLDSNIIKSMAYEESRMGTFGEHLALPPYDWATNEHHFLKARFNIVQAIDSAEEQQLLMMEELAHKEIFLPHGLDKLKKEHKSRGLKRAEFYTWDRGQFVSALEKFFKLRDKKGLSLMGHSKDLHEDYDFWVRTAIRWLFVKYEAVGRDWKEAVRAYNGSGPKAVAYRKRILARTGAKTPLDVSED
ncbi:hypothetical protein [Archangium sp.]|uniref:hypothetical protein n=1 Tax=Archangium sp. TaxID=1872627 RepID=UPI00286CA162|nr:hypothetical protein [Archangium sp.]